MLPRNTSGPKAEFQRILTKIGTKIHAAGTRRIPANYFTKGIDAAQVICDTLFYVNMQNLAWRISSFGESDVDNSGDNCSESGKLYNKRDKIKWHGT